MPKQSAGLLLYRKVNPAFEIFLVHPGGPLWAKKDDGAWSLPKGQYSDAEDPLTAAKREFKEETGIAVEGEFLTLGQVKQAGGKLVTAWALEMDIDPGAVKSNTFSIEWPPRSGKAREFPEIDKGEWFSIPSAKLKLLKGQLAFIDRLLEKLGVSLQSS